RDRVDLAFGGVMRAERRAVVETAPAIPFAVPGGVLQGTLQHVRMLFPGLGVLVVALRLGDGGEVAQRTEQEPAEPHALTLALFADAVHAVVPVAAEDQRQAGRAAALDGEVERAGAMLIERNRALGDFRREESVVLA